MSLPVRARVDHGGSVADRFFWQPHATPWSVWLFVAVYPVLMLAVYRRDRWLLAGVCLLVLVTLRVVSPPDSDEPWATRVVLGERVWLEEGLRTSNRDLNVLLAGAVVQLATFYAALCRRPLGTAVGAGLAVVSIFVFFARMVSRYEDATDRG